MEILFTNTANKDYLDFQKSNRKSFKKINDLIESIISDGLLGGIGKPEKLKYCDDYSRKITKRDRLVYSSTDDGNLLIVSCKGHYEE
jgi:toxin YoeB